MAQQGTHVCSIPTEVQTSGETLLAVHLYKEKAEVLQTSSCWLQPGISLNHNPAQIKRQGNSCRHAKKLLQYPTVIRVILATTGHTRSQKSTDLPQQQTATASAAVASCTAFLLPSFLPCPTALHNTPQHTSHLYQHTGNHQQTQTMLCLTMLQQTMRCVFDAVAATADE